MRDIKFRAWDIEYKRMHDVYAIDFVETEILVLIPGKPKAIWDDLEGYELIQYTGLKDKNGKEIYESDVVRFLWTPYNPRETEPPKRTRTGFITWCDGCFMLDNVSMGTIERIDSWSWQLEVIGNIHENPELLK